MRHNSQKRRNSHESAWQGTIRGVKNLTVAKAEKQSVCFAFVNGFIPIANDDYVDFEEFEFYRNSICDTPPMKRILAPILLLTLLFPPLTYAVTMDDLVVRDGIHYEKSSDVTSKVGNTGLMIDL